jgi:hypothetical protein
MSQQRFDDEEQKFNTINLLQGVEAADLPLDDILSEIGSWTVKPAPLTAGGKPQVEETTVLPDLPDPEPAQPEAPQADVSQPEPEPEPAPKAKERPRATRTPKAVPIPAQPEPEQPPEPPAAPQPEKKPSRFQFVRMDLDRTDRAPGPAAPEPELETPEAPLPASPVPNDLPPGQPFGGEHHSSRVILPEEDVEEEDLPEPVLRQEKKRRKRPPEPTRPEPSVGGALRFYGKTVRQVRARLMPAMVLSILAAVVTLSAAFGWALVPAFEQAANRNVTLLVLQAAVTLLCFDVAARGVYDAMRMSFAMESLATVVDLLILVTAAVQVSSPTPPFCAVGCFVMTFTLWGNQQKRVAMRRSLKPLASAETVTDVRRVSGLWEDGACIIKNDGVTEGFITDMEKQDRVDTMLGIYGPVLLAVTLVAAGILRMRLDVSFLWSWMALLCAGLPLLGGSCFARPWAVLARRLQRQGAAISGWHGVKVLSGARGVTVRDGDLFPEDSMRVSGIKLFGDFRADLVVGYAASLIVPLGGSLAPLFRTLQAEQGGQWFEPAGLRAFEGGGVGADIRGDVVQVGSMSFMQLMGVRLPRGTNVRQAVYVSINGELAGLFAISYQKSKGVQRGLRAVTAQGLRPIFAVRDFLLSPAILRQLFGLSQDSLEYPRVEVRLELSQPLTGTPGARGAILTRDNMAAYAETVCGAVRLRSATRRNLLLCAVGGALGVVLTLVLLGSSLSLTAFPALILAYSLLWSGIFAVSSLAAARF